MRKIILTCLLLLLVGSAEAGDENVCAKRVILVLSEVNAPIEFANEKKRIDRVKLTMPVYCRGGRYIKPIDANDAVMMLDFSLPLDLKQGLLGGGYANPYLDAHYGASVMEDLYHFYSDAWDLSSDAVACRKASVDEERPSCFFTLINKLRAGYREGAAK